MLYVYVITQSGGWILTTGTALHITILQHTIGMKLKKRIKKEKPCLVYSCRLPDPTAIPLLQPEQALVQRLHWGGVETTRQGTLN